jgi:hypothetical protein
MKNEIYIQGVVIERVIDEENRSWHIMGKILIPVNESPFDSRNKIDIYLLELPELRQCAIYSLTDRLIFTVGDGWQFGSQVSKNGRWV